MPIDDLGAAVSGLVEQAARAVSSARKEDHVKHNRRTTILASMALLCGFAAAGCKGDEEAWTKRLSDANDKVLTCKKDLNDLKAQNAELKQKLAQAMTAPARVQLTDPDILNLIAEIKGKQGSSGEEGDIVLGKGDLNPKEASKVVRQGAQALQKCYERALKKNSALQMQSGLGVMLEITVKPTGLVQAMNLSPHIDGEMTDCVRTTVARWKFPPFAGESVVVTQKLTLTPKT
jgi:hypothetical protein